MSHQDCSVPLAAAAAAAVAVPSPWLTVRLEAVEDELFDSHCACSTCSSTPCTTQAADGSSLASPSSSNPALLDTPSLITFFPYNCAPAQSRTRLFTAPLPVAAAGGGKYASRRRRIQDRETRSREHTSTPCDSQYIAWQSGLSVSTRTMRNAYSKKGWSSALYVTPCSRLAKGPARIGYARRVFAFSIRVRRLHPKQPRPGTLRSLPAAAAAVRLRSSLRCSRTQPVQPPPPGEPDRSLRILRTLPGP